MKQSFWLLCFFQKTINQHLNAFLQFHIGYVLQYNLIGIANEGSTLPSYDIQKWFNGATVVFTLFSVSFENGNRLGWYVSGYRGSQIYEDMFNLKDFEIPGSSYVKTGIVYQFKTK